MRDKTHAEQIERWAEYVKSTPRAVWKPKLNAFIDAQFDMADKFRANLKKSEKGREILKGIIELRRRGLLKTNG